MDWGNVDNGGCAPACIISSLQDFFSALIERASSRRVCAFSDSFLRELTYKYPTWRLSFPNFAFVVWRTLTNVHANIDQCSLEHWPMFTRTLTNVFQPLSHNLSKTTEQQAQRIRWSKIVFSPKQRHQQRHTEKEPKIKENPLWRKRTRWYANAQQWCHTAECFILAKKSNFLWNLSIYITVFCKLFYIFATDVLFAEHKRPFDAPWRTESYGHS